MALNKESLKKFLKQTKLIIKSIKETKTTNSTVLEVELAEPVERVKGSIPTQDGDDMILRNVTTVYVHDTDIEAFYENSEDAGDVIEYSGTLDMDVSKPKGYVKNGRFVATKQAAVWLTSVAFKNRAQEFRAEQQDQTSLFLSSIFGGKKSLEEIKARRKQLASGAGVGELEPVDDSAGG